MKSCGKNSKQHVGNVYLMNTYLIIYVCIDIYIGSSIYLLLLDSICHKSPLVGGRRGWKWGCIAWRLHHNKRGGLLVLSRPSSRLHGASGPRGVQPIARGYEEHRSNAVRGHATPRTRRFHLLRGALCHSALHLRVCVIFRRKFLSEYTNPYTRLPESMWVLMKWPFNVHNRDFTVWGTRRRWSLINFRWLHWLWWESYANSTDKNKM